MGNYWGLMAENIPKQKMKFFKKQIKKRGNKKKIGPPKIFDHHDRPHREVFVLTHAF